LFIVILLITQFDRSLNTNLNLIMQLARLL